MRRLSLALASAAVLSLATAAFGATTDSLYHKLWKKSVSGDQNKPKVGCICLDNGALGALLFVQTPDQGFAYCGVPSFNPDGPLSGSSPCLGRNFAVLPK